MSVLLAALVVALAQKSPGEVAKGLMAPTLRPDAVFKGLRVGEGKTLPEALRVQVARAATRRLAAGLDAIDDPAARIDVLRPAWDQARELPAAVRQPIERLHQATRRHLLLSALDDVRVPANAGRWADAADKARSWTVRLREVRPVEDKEFMADHAAVEAACGSAVEVVEKLAALDAYRAALEDKGPARAIDAARLPESLKGGASALRGLAELSAAAAAKWEKAPDATSLRESLARLAAGLEADLAKRVALDIAVKALAEGHPAVALKLLPADAPADHAAELLRDLKALTLGGERGEAPSGPPPSVLPLIPEAKRAEWRPPARGKTAAALDEAKKAGAKIREGALAAIAAERGKLDATAARKALNDAHARAIAPEAEERKRHASVEYRLGRRLTAAERTTVREWVEDGKALADLLPKLAAPDDEERFLAEFARLLGRDPTPEQRQQARAMRRDGRRAAEAAELLR